MKENFLTILTAATGAAATEVAQQVTEANSPELVQVVIQIVIGIATLFQLLRKKKDKTPQV